MKRLLCFALLLMLGALAFGQSTKVPTCNSWSALPPSPGVPVFSLTKIVPDPAGSPNCTDYFGTANWANSPLPTGAIAGFSMMLGGSGYTAPVVNITDPTGTGAAAASATVDPVSGAITGITGGLGGSGYLAPVVTITDPTGTGALVSATIGPPFVGGMPKFVATDLMPDLKATIPLPDIITFPGSDFYVIGLTQYTQVMHSSLPGGTTLRGYCQLANAASTTCLSVPSYLGPVIVATKGRPVRVLFKNMLSTGAAGNLFIPVDSTYMGAGADANSTGPFTENRATLHLHGGNTPWVSDGTTMQWTAPAGETGPPRGDSVQFVPDMWFDSTGALIATCAGLTTCTVAGATNDPGAGNLTFFWTNQQGGRLMFYHDHAYGITRLNVYAGEAAGYLLVDPTEEDKLAAATVPGTMGTTPDPTHLIPLVIQDKTFVPSAAQLAAEDPTWAANFGLTPGVPRVGDLWFPHIYTTNQNPADPTGGNAFGRWDYGAWFFPPMTSLTAATPPSAVTIPCTTAAFPGVVLAPAPANNNLQGCPIIPNPSGTPEGFMDTPLVNGKAYPVLHVAPAAYRFQILAAGNDRSWNLQLYVADATQNNTEVAMVPAVIPTPGVGLQLCPQMNPITNTSLGIGLAQALLDGTGNPLNGTGMPAGCRPWYGNIPGILPRQTIWVADGRLGGGPDPTKAGPAMIEIGTEGGLLPAPVAIPSTPTNYEWNTRSITITNVGIHGLWIGPAERADVIVDFTKFAGQTLILYNDAPTPAPAFDSRLDYFTGDGDQASIGGAPNTQPGFGPNTRTIMQIVVDQVNPNLSTFSLPALKAAFKTTTVPPAAPNGLFASTQPTTIVPEAAYSSAYNATLPNTFGRISDNTVTFTPVGSLYGALPLTFESLLAAEPSQCPVTPPALPTQCATMNQKAIQELFTLDYGRMNATLGTELPLTNFNVQTTIPLGYVDPATEIIRDGDTQIWKITHNGVDTHFIHFHLVNVQVLNRVGWDGSLRPVEENEVGWKDTVRMNPLEDIFVAMTAKSQTLPWPVRNSFRLMDVTVAPGATNASGASFSAVQPFTNGPVNTANAVQNFGWEYVWHCHILGHEENDMMRPIIFQVPPPAPSNLTAVEGNALVNLSFIDNSASETGFTVQRDETSPNFVLGDTITTFTLPPSPTLNAAGEGTDFGSTIKATDSNGIVNGTIYYYRVQAVDNGFAVAGMEQSYNTPTSPLLSAWSNVASTGGATPIASVSPLSLTFASVYRTTSAPQPVTVTNAGGAGSVLTIGTLAITGDFAISGTTCGASLASGVSCTISVTFTPTAIGIRTGTLTIPNNGPGPVVNVGLTGTATPAPVTVTASSASIPYGSAVPTITPIIVGLIPPDTLGTITCSTTYTGIAPNKNAGTYPSTCTGAANPNYTITNVPGTVTVTAVPLTITASSATVAYGGPVPTITPSFAGFIAGETSTNLTTQPTCSTTYTGIAPNKNAGTYPSTCTGAVDPNYAISYVAGTVTVTAVPLTITASSATVAYGSPVPTITASYAGFVAGDTAASLTTPPTCSTTYVVGSGVAGSPYPSTCSGAVDPNYTISYVAGTVTVTAVPLLITAPSPSVPYGSAVPTLTPTATGLVAGDTIANLTTQPTCTTTYTAGAAVSGSPYPTSCSGAVDANYTFSYVSGSVTVTAVPLTITASSAGVAYGAPAPTITPSISGFVNGDTSASLTAQPVCSTTYKVGSGVAGNPYPSSCTGAASPNYTFIYVNGTVTVSAVPLTITGPALTVPYGSAVPTITPTATGLVAGDTIASLTGLTCTTTYTQGSGISGSPYPITCSGATDPNYAPISYVNGSVTVTTASLTITASSAAVNYGAPAPAITPSYAGFVGADTPASLTTQPTCSTTYTQGSPVSGSPYPTSCSGAVDANYTIGYVTGTVTVAKMAASVTPNAASKPYGNPDPPLTGTLTGFLQADNVSATYSRNAGETVGTYTISATLNAAPGVLANYSITQSTAVFTITPLAASVTPNPASKIYGQTDPALTGTLSGFLTADNVTATYSRTPGETVGTYAISATLSPAAVLVNYAITYNTAAFTINPATTITTITAQVPNPSSVNQAVLIGFRVSPQFTGTPTGSVSVTASTGEGCSGALTNGVGSCSITFTTPGSRTLTASYTGDTNFLGSISAGVTQRVAGGFPVASVSPTTLPFGNQLVNTTSPAQTATLSNTGTAPLAINSITVAGTGFARSGGTCANNLAAGRSCTITVTFRPNAAGPFNGTLTIASNDPVNPTLTVTLTGTGVVPVASLGTLNPSPLVSTRGCTGVACASGTVSLTNTGGAPLTINSISIGGTNASQFAITGNTCASPLAAGSSCTVTVTFRPPLGTTAGTKTATLRVRDNSNGINFSLQTAALTGTAQ